MSADSHDIAEDLRRNAVGGLTINQALEPSLVLRVILGIGTERVDQDVYV